MDLIHYFNGNMRALHTVSDGYCSEDVLQILKSLTGRAFNRFRNYEWYIEQRVLTEKWLYESFLEIGGTPIIIHPRYFVLGESPYLCSCYGESVRQFRLPYDAVDETDISFTLNDSMKNYLDNNKVIFTKSKLHDYAASCGMTIEALARDKAQHQEYIEAQIWNLRYFDSAK